MIKAEVISHEGNPGPTWLDKCRALITPTSTSVLILVLATGGLIVGIVYHHRGSKADLAASQQPPASSLQVKPLTSLNSVAGSASSAGVQAATSNTSAGPSDTTANALGAGSTPSLNTAKSTAGATNSQNQASDQGQLNGSSLTNTVQTTVQDITQTLQHPLGL